MENTFKEIEPRDARKNISLLQHQYKVPFINNIRKREVSKYEEIERERYLVEKICNPGPPYKSH